MLSGPPQGASALARAVVRGRVETPACYSAYSPEENAVPNSALGLIRRQRIEKVGLARYKVMLTPRIS